jgi:hypothetical protein
MVLAAAAFAILPSRAVAHCDTLDGPVVADAKLALEKNDVTPVLKWVTKDDEKPIHAIFAKTLAVRTKGPEAKELADMYFFETLVRLHRAAEGAPYTGLKPAGAAEPGIAQADKALADGSVDELVKSVTHAVELGIRARFADAAEAKKQAEANVEAGRKFVKAYVEFIHYVEALHQFVASGPAHHPQPDAAPAAHEHDAHK